MERAHIAQARAKDQMVDAPAENGSRYAELRVSSCRVHEQGTWMGPEVAHGSERATPGELAP